VRANTCVNCQPDVTVSGENESLETSRMGSWATALTAKIIGKLRDNTDVVRFKIRPMRKSLSANDARETVVSVIGRALRFVLHAFGRTAAKSGSPRQSPESGSLRQGEPWHRGSVTWMATGRVTANTFGVRGGWPRPSQLERMRAT